mmetsp:Transcript_1702/g.6829  ORF Transcript_1702/g.6829 Transcript_1702/m.6829 type:complete len:218 (+) Transcript_1702:69-722(+)
MPHQGGSAVSPQLARALTPELAIIQLRDQLTPSQLPLQAGGDRPLLGAGQAGSQTPPPLNSGIGRGCSSGRCRYNLCLRCCAGGLERKWHLPQRSSSRPSAAMKPLLRRFSPRMISLQFSKRNLTLSLSVAVLKRTDTGLMAPSTVRSGTRPRNSCLKNSLASSRRAVHSSASASLSNPSSVSPSKCGKRAAFLPSKATSSTSTAPPAAAASAASGT